MKWQDLNYFNIGPRLTLAFALLISLVLGGNGLVLWQFQMVRLQTGRLTGGNQQVIAALQLDRNLLLFYHQLDDLVERKDAQRFMTEAGPLSKTLLEQIKQTRKTLTHLPAKTRVDTAFLPTLDAIETDLPSQIEGFSALAKLGEWELVRTRLASGMNVLESQISNLVTSIDQESGEELMNAVSGMRDGQRRIAFVVPITAISTVFIAAFFAWAVTRRMLELRVEERVAERTRVARELHDTLLQSFQGLMLRFQTVDEMLPARPMDAKTALEGALDRADQAISEGRDAITDIRASTLASHDLEKSISALMTNLSEELAAGDGSSVTFRVLVEGEPRAVRPTLQDEIYRIARESLRNAFRHAQAGHIETEITYGESLRLRFRDDGKGMDPSVVEHGGRSGHWGLPGIHERAKQIGAELTVWSELGAGTEVELTIPGSIAYEASPTRPRFRLFRKRTEQDHEHRS
jgi:signal transduction histidine kinase